VLIVRTEVEVLSGDGVTLGGVKLQAAPAGKPVQEKVTPALNLPIAVTEIITVED
jgi:hypothetical protein